MHSHTTAAQARQLARQRCGSIYAVAVDAGASLAATGATDCMVRVFDARAGTKVSAHCSRLYDSSRTTAICSVVAVDAGATLAATGATDCMVRVFDARAGTKVSD